VNLASIPRFLAWLPEIVLAAMFFRVSLFIISGRRPWVGAGRAIDMSVVLLAGLGLLGALMNGTAPVTVVLGLRGWFKFIIMFYLLLNIDLDLRVLENAFNLIWLLVFVQPYLVFVQWLKEDCRNCFVDAYYGTLMSTATLGIVAGLAAAFAVALFVERGERKYLVLTVPMLFSLGLADAKGGFALVAIGVAAALLLTSIRTRRRTAIRRAIIPALVIGLALYYAIDFGSRNLNVDISSILLNPQVLDYKIYDPDAHQALSRDVDLQLGLQTAHNLATGGWLGSGPGSASISVFDAYTGQQQLTVTEQFDRPMFWVNSSRLLVESGFLGLMAWAWLYGALFHAAQSTYRVLRWPIWRARAMALTGFVAVIVSAQFYQYVLDIPTFVLWFTAALLLRAKREHANISVRMAGR
jgi:hypothetical protein